MICCKPISNVDENNPMNLNKRNSRFKCTRHARPITEPWIGCEENLKMSSAAATTLGDMMENIQT